MRGVQVSDLDTVLIQTAGNSGKMCSCRNKQVITLFRAKSGITVVDNINLEAQLGEGPDNHYGLNVISVAAVYRLRLPQKRFDDVCKQCGTLFRSIGTDGDSLHMAFGRILFQLEADLS